MKQPKKKTIIFYSEEEINLIKEYASNRRSDRKNVNALSRKLRRPRSGVYAKYHSIKKSIADGSTVTAVKTKTTSSKKIMDVPKGMILEFPASKIHMEEGKITLFF